MPTHPRSHRRLLRAGAMSTGLIAAAALALAALPSSAQAAPHATTPKIQSVSVSGEHAKVKSSKHKTLSVSVSGSNSTNEPLRPAVPRAHAIHRTAAGSSTQGNLDVTLSNASEFHQWDFSVPTSALVVKSSGKGTYKVPATKLSPFGTVKLSFAPKGKPTLLKCEGTTVSKVQKVTLSGTFFFDTRSGKHGWGTVGSKKSKFTFTSNATVEWSYVTTASCQPDFTSFCQTSTFWDAFTENGDLQGAVVPRKGVSASRQVKLSKPAGAFRYDNKSAGVKSETFSSTSTTATLTVTGNGSSSTGSATITGSDPNTFSNPCGKTGQTQNMTSWNGTFTNGSKPLEVHDIFGVIGAKTGSDAEITKYSVTSAQ